LYYLEARDHYSTWPPLQPKENNPILKIKIRMAMVLVVDVKQLQANTIHKQNRVTKKKTNGPIYGGSWGRGKKTHNHN